MNVSRNRSLAIVCAAFACACAVRGVAGARAAWASEPWPPANAPKVQASDESPSPEAAPVRPEGDVVQRVPAASLPSVSKSAQAPASTRPLGLGVGTRDGQLFLGTPGERFVLLPTARFELDGRVLETAEPNASARKAALGEARLELTAWVGQLAAVTLGADFAARPSLRHADNFIALARRDERAILQVGQFDAPFSLENRTAERYLDFGERAVAVQAFALPAGKAQGLMLHGTNPKRSFYYAAGALDAEGSTIPGNGRVDLMARAWIAPFAFGDPEGLHDVRVGGSVWTGDRSMTPEFGAQSTGGGYVFLDPSLWWTDGTTTRALDLRQHGRLAAAALELDAPFAHRFGLRFEWIAKRQPLAAVDIAAAHPTRLGGLTLSGYATYLEAWAWLVGDDRILGAPASPGLALPIRLRDFPVVPARHGVMLAARVERVDEDLSASADVKALSLGVASAGKTNLTSASLAVSYWYTRRVRVLASYVFNHLDGTTPYVAGLDAKNEHELLFRTVLAL